MPWNSLWSDFVKKRACRYLLNHYLGQFLQEKLTLDQLSVDLYNGTGVIKELSLDVLSLNEALNTYNIPFEIVDGYVGSITVSVPWSALINDSTEVEVDGLELTIQPKQRADNGTTLEEMFTSMTSMTSSLQLAQEVFRQDSTTGTTHQTGASERFEGVEKFAQTIDSVLSRVKVTFNNTTVRLEHLPKEASVGVALELRIKRMEYFDDMAMGQGGSSDDKSHIMEPAAICHKNFRLMGVSMFADEFNRASRAPTAKGSSIDSQVYESSSSSINLSPELSQYPSTITSQHMGTGFPFVLSEPVKIAMLSGTQEFKVKLKQNDSLQGPKLEVDSHFGSLHILLTPRQVHILMELASGLASPDTCDNSRVGHHGHKNKPMAESDYGRVESELQRQLQSGRFQNQGAGPELTSLPITTHPDTIMVQHSLDSSDDEVYFSMQANRPSSTMDSSFSSSLSSATNTSKTSSQSTLKCNSSIPLGEDRRDSFSRPSKSPLSKDVLQKFPDDPGAELTRYKLKLSFFSLTILHENPSSSPGDVMSPGVSAVERLKSVSETFFNRVGLVSTTGFSVDLTEHRQKFSEACPHDHLGFLGKPFSLECMQKTSAYKQSLSLDLTISRFEAVEALFDRNDNTMSSHGFSLPIHNKLPEYSELLVFDEEDLETKPYQMFSSIHASTPCVKLKLDNVETSRSSHRKHVPPRTDVSLELGRCSSEVDITIVDRIHTLMNPDPLTPDPSTSRLYTSYAPNYNLAGAQCLSEDVTDEGSGEDRRIEVNISAAYAQIHFRFPIPILGTGPQVGPLAWWKRRLRKEVLIAEFTELCFQTKYIPIDNLQQYEFTCKEVHGQLQEEPGQPPVSFIHVRQDVDSTSNGSEDEFNWPRLVINSYCKKSSVLEEEQVESDDSTPMDSLNGACQFAKPESSPFSSRKYMYEKEDVSGKSDVTHTSEEMVLPGEKEEMREFQEKALGNTLLSVELCLPDVIAVLPSKQFFELLYNRVNNDLLLWSPKAPSPIQPQDYPVFPSQSALNSIRVTKLLQEGGIDHFQLCKSGLRYDSDSDSDENMDTTYSIHDNRRGGHKRRLEGRQLPSKLCFSINITKGKLLACIPIKTDDDEVNTEQQGEIILDIDDANVFVVSSYKGDKDLEYICVQSNQATLYHDNSVPIPANWPPTSQAELSPSIRPDPRCAIYKSEAGVYGKLTGLVGCGQDSKDMLAVAVKIKLDTLNNIKEFTVSLGVKGATLQHRMLPSGCSWISQIMEFLDVKDYPIQGYVEPKVITELHIHLWSCAIDYRPLYLPTRAMLTVEAFNVSSNIVTGSSTSLLRFLIDDAALFISDNLKALQVDLKKNYVCVMDMDRFELSLCSADGKNLKTPKTDLRISTNKVNIRTCSDSGKALTDLLQYFAKDGDLSSKETEVMDLSNLSSSPGLASLTKEERTRSNSTSSGGLSESRMEHVHDLMEDAMRESSSSPSGSESPERQKSKNTTQVFFYPTVPSVVKEEGDHLSQSGEADTIDTPLPLLTGNLENLDHFTADRRVTSPDQTKVISPDSPRVFSPRRIVISDSQDSIGSSTFSERTERISDEEGFCIIDNPGLGIVSKDGEPKVRKFTESVIEIRENYFSQPLGRGDLLKAPEHYPPPVYRYTLKEMNVQWQMFGGNDLGQHIGKNAKDMANKTDSKSLKKDERKPNSPKQTRHKERSNQALPWQSKGGAGRDLDTLLELHLSKVRFQHEVYPEDKEQASRQVLLIQDMEIRDRLATSLINKFLYQFSSETKPKQSHANMVLLKAVHSRPDLSRPAQECGMRVSLLPIRLNVDQDALFFLRKFFTEIAGGSLVEPPVKVTRSPSRQGSPSSPASKQPPSVMSPPPVMAVGDTIDRCEDLEETINLIKFDEFIQAEEDDEGDMYEMTDLHQQQPVFFKSFVFSPDVPIRLDYHGKRVRMEQGTLAGLLAGLAQLNCSELKLKGINYKHGLLGVDKLLQYTLNEWLGDIKKNQIPGILGGVGPMYSIVQIVQGIRDLFWLPVEQYQRDGRIMRGLQRGATSFTTSTAMAVLELTNRLVQSVQYVAELTYDMVSPGPGVRLQQNQYQQLQTKIKRSMQPSDLREGVAKAYGVIREGISGTAKNIVKVATEEHDQKGLTGAVGGVLREIPPTIVKPIILASAATSNVLGGMRNQLKPDAKREDEEKWRLQGEGSFSP